MAHDVFISYSQHDKPTADAACAALEMAGSRCWIAPRDVPPGVNWPSAILDGIGKSRVMVLIFSSHAVDSKDVQREVAHAFRNGVTVIPFRIENIEPKGDMAYFIGTTHWLDAMSPPLRAHLGRLCQTVKSLLPTLDEAAGVRPAAGRGSPAVGIEKGVGPTVSHTAPRPLPAQGLAPSETRRPRSNNALLFVVVGSLAIAIVGYLLWKVGQQPTTTAAGPPPTSPAAATTTDDSSTSKTAFSMSVKIKKVAEVVAREARERGKSSIAVGNFDQAPPAKTGFTGLRAQPELDPKLFGMTPAKKWTYELQDFHIRQRLADALTAEGLKVDETGDLRLDGYIERNAAFKNTTATLHTIYFWVTASDTGKKLISGDALFDDND